LFLATSLSDPLSLKIPWLVPLLVPLNPLMKAVWPELLVLGVPRVINVPPPAPGAACASRTIALKDKPSPWKMPLLLGVEVLITVVIALIAPAAVLPPY